MSVTVTSLIATQGKVWLTYTLEHDQEEDDIGHVDEDEEDSSDFEDNYDSDIEQYINFQR